MLSATLAACSPPPQFSATSLTPRQLLERYRSSDSKCLTSGIYYFQYRTTTSEGDVSVYDFYESRGRGKTPDFRTVATIRGLRGERGRISDRSWLQTGNGLVVPDSPLPTPFDRVLRAAARGPDVRARMLGITTAVPHRYVLELNPNPRIAQRLYFDPGSFLLRKVETQDYDRAVRVERFSRYIPVCGKPVPTRIDRSNSFSRETSETVLLRHERLADPRLLAIPLSRTPFVPQARLPATLNSLFGASGILIRVDIAGQPYWFALDSGAPSVTLDRTLVQRLGGHEFATSIATKGGTFERSAAVIPRLDIGPVYATNLAVSVVNHDYVQQGVHVVGLLGCDFIASRPLGIDFRSQTVVVGSVLPVGNRRWTRIATPLDSCVPTIRSRLENQPATLLLDLGSPLTTINEDVYERIAASVHELGSEQLEFIGGEPLDATRYVVPIASIGSLSLAPLLAAVVAGGRGQDLYDDGLLGFNALDKYRIVLDYRNEQTYFQEYDLAGGAESAF